MLKSHRVTCLGNRVQIPQTITKAAAPNITTTVELVSAAMSPGNVMFVGLVTLTPIGRYLARPASRDHFLTSNKILLIAQKFSKTSFRRFRHFARISWDRLHGRIAHCTTAIEMAATPAPAIMSTK
jgi:hypothetical protein